MSLLKRLNPIAAIADQAWLSLLSFAIALAFIWGAEKIEYGHYILLTTPLLLVQSIQNALVNSPLATILPAAEPAAQLQLKSTAISIHVFLGGAAALLGGVALFVYGQLSGFDANSFLIGGFSLAIMGTVAREAQRALAYANREGPRALLSDLVYGGLLLAGLGAAIVGEEFTAAVVLAATGFAGLAPLLVKIGAIQELSIHSGSLQKFWSCGRWALPSVLATWVTLSSYPYFASTYLDIAAVAEIGAARLFLMPIGLVTTAWGNWYRPLISRWFADGDLVSIKRATNTSLVVGALAMSFTALLLFVAYPMAEPLLGPQYQGLQNLVLIWLIYFALALARNIFMATLMVDANGYRILHHVTWVALALAMPCFMLFSANGAVWVIGILCSIEFFQLIVVVIKATRYWQQLNGRRGENA
jgi:O-antigen/teichoic acid export membrane protein